MDPKAQELMIDTFIPILALFKTGKPENFMVVLAEYRGQKDIPIICYTHPSKDNGGKDGETDVFPLAIMLTNEDTDPKFLSLPGEHMTAEDND